MWPSPIQRSSVEGSKPTPSSLTARVIVSPACRSATHTVAASACRATLPQQLPRRAEQHVLRVRHTDGLELGVDVEAAISALL